MNAPPGLDSVNASLPLVGYRVPDVDHRSSAVERLRRNVTQIGLAQAANLSLNTLKALESGKGKLSTLIAVLRELDALGNLDDFIPVQQISPLQLAKMQGKQRRRATGSRARPTGNADSR